jgi:hypothetical protein
MFVRPADVDPLLLPFLEAADEARARDLLGDVLIAHASPLIRQVLQRQLLQAGSTLMHRQEADDLHAALLLRLTAQLFALRRGELPAPVASLSSYVAAAAFKACHEWLRQRAPRLAHLRSRVRYVLTRDPRLVMREVADREWWCAARDVSNQPSAAGDEDVRRAADEQLVAVRRATGEPSGSPRAFAEFVRATLEALGRPCRFGSLVSALAECLGEYEGQPTRARSADDGDRRESARRDGARRDGARLDGSRLDEIDATGMAAARPTVVDELMHRERLRQLWAEIEALPPRQRAALLLNLRDDDGRGMIELWPESGAASRADLARALELTGEQLDELWPTLPRDDQWIAAHLGVTRRQVINLRKCARRRLTRRLKTIVAPAGTGR